MRIATAAALTLAAVTAAVQLAPSRAAAFPFDVPGVDEPMRLDITESLYFDSHWDNDDDDDGNDHYYDFRNRLNLELGIGPHALGVRLDSAFFIDAPSDAYEDDYIRPEKVYFRSNHANYSLTLGDYYAVFGRGIALYIRKVDELSFDPSLRGAYLNLRGDWFSATVLAGIVNTLNVDDRSERLKDDPDDLVLGVRLEETIADQVTLGQHVVAVLNRDDFPPAAEAPQHRIITGLSAEAFDVAGVVTLYGEVNAMFRADETYGNVDQGGVLVSQKLSDTEGRSWAGYVAATLDIDAVTALFEFRHYDDWRLTPTQDGDRISSELSYVRPPTLERTRERFIENLEDSTGFRGRVDYTFPTNTTLYVNGLYLMDAPVEDGYTAHVYGGVTQRVDSWGLLADVAGGYRWEKQERRGKTEDWGREWHVDAEMEAHLGGPHSVDLTYSHEGFSRWELGKRRDFRVGQLTATYSYAPWIDVAFLFGYTTEFKDRREFYYGGDVRLRFTSDSFLRVFVGQRKGGTICVNGSCREEPPLEGIRSELVMRF